MTDADKTKIIQELPAIQEEFERRRFSSETRYIKTSGITIEFTPGEEVHIKYEDSHEWRRVRRQAIPMDIFKDISPAVIITQCEELGC